MLSFQVHMHRMVCFSYSWEVVLQYLSVWGLNFKWTRSDSPLECAQWSCFVWCNSVRKDWCWLLVKSELLEHWTQLLHEKCVIKLVCKRSLLVTPYLLQALELMGKTMVGYSWMCKHSGKTKSNWWMPVAFLTGWHFQD